MRDMTPRPFRVVSLESRHAAEMTRLLERHGCMAISAPSMREVPLGDEREVLAFGEQLMTRGFDMLVLLTGAGMRVIAEVLATRWAREDVIAALGRTQLVCRGPKPVAVLKQLGLRASLVAPEPNTWRNVLEVLDRGESISGKRVVVQEYGKPSPELVAALRERGAEVRSVAVYAWALPEDTGPLERAVETLCASEADALLITSGRQIEHLLSVAERLGKRAALMHVLDERVLLASIGPVATETLLEHGLVSDLEPEHPKMGHLVLAVAQDGPRLHAAKQERVRH
jgi:uroporphyrinogen-III synthase